MSGTASWNYVAITQWILGIRPTYTGLQIAPVIPDNWQGFKVKRIFRGVPYEINVRRVGPGNRARLEVDSEILDDNIVPLPGASTSAVQVEVFLGEAGARN